MNFYKYMTYRPEFFQNLMIRATPADKLNDPFEFNFNTEQIRKYLDNLGLDTEKSIIDNDVEVLQCDYSTLGVISFSEKYDNNVMWSHYANEHYGFVIEFSISNEDSFFDNIFSESPFGNTFISPTRVVYNNKPLDFSLIENMGKQYIDILKREYPFKRFSSAILLSKSMDWSYEQELRIIVELKDADKIIFSIENENDAEDIIGRLRKECDKDKRIIFEYGDTKKLSITFPECYESHNEEYGDASIKKEIFFQTISYNPIHLFRINPKCIKGIFLGLRFSEENLTEKIENTKLQNVKFYKMEQCENSYLLKASLLCHVLPTNTPPTAKVA